MDQQLLNAFIESLTDIIADKVVQRLRASAEHPSESSLVPAVSAPSVPPAALPEYLTTREAAELLKLTPKGLEGMRANGRGPKYLRIGSRIRYRRSDLGS